MMHENNDHRDILKELGMSGLADPAAAASIDAALAGDLPTLNESEIREEEARLELMEVETSQIEGPWFLAFASSPIIAARWIPGQGWDVTIMEGEGAQLIDPRKRNLLHKAMTIALRRHERRRVFNHRVGGLSENRQKQKEVEQAIARSKADGTYIEYPGQKV